MEEPKWHRQQKEDAEHLKFENDMREITQKRRKNLDSYSVARVYL